MSICTRSGFQTVARAIRRGTPEPANAVGLTVLVVLGLLLTPSASPAQTAELFLQSNVPNATVSVDGREVGATNSDGEVLLEGLAPGRHTIRLRKPGYWTASTQTTLEQGLTNVVSLELTARDVEAAELRIETNVPEARVVLDGTPRGETGADGQVSLSNVEPGSHRLVVRKDGYAPTTRTVSVSGSVSNQTVQVRLEREDAGADLPAQVEEDTSRAGPPAPSDSTIPDSAAVAEEAEDALLAHLVVSANVERAQVYVGGTFRGTTNRSGELDVEADSGQYQVVVRKDGFANQQKTVRLAAGEDRTLPFTLDREESSSALGQDRLPMLAYILAGVVAVGGIAVAVVVVWRRRSSTSHEKEDGLDRYRALEPIDRDGITSLYRAEDSVEDRQVVLKVLDEAYEDDPAIVESFLKQGEALRHIAASQPDVPVVNAYRYGREKEWNRKRAFIELECVQGDRLSTYLEGHDPEVREALTVIRQVCTGLQAAHDRQLWHGALTPGNIIVTRTEPEIRVKLVNFQVGARHRIRQKETVQAPLWNPAYMSPEQCRAEEIDGSTDVYAAGILFCTIVTGGPPYADQNPRKVMKMHQTAPRPRLSEVPQYIEPLFHRMLSTDPAERPAASNIAAMIDLMRETT